MCTCLSVCAFTLVSVVTLCLFDPSDQDEEIRKIQAAVATGMTANASHLQAYLKTWNKYRDIWENNQDSFIQRYQRLNPPVTTFDADIQRHCPIKQLFLSKLLFTIMKHTFLLHFCFMPILWFTPRYTEKASSVQQEETVLNIWFVTLDCSPLKSSLVQLCSEWQTKFTQLLSHMASTRLKDLHASLQDNANR